MSPVVAPGRACPRDASNRLPVGLHLLRRVPATGDDVTLVLPSVNAEVMDLFLAHFADTVDHDAHAVMILDGAGWHDARALT